KCRDIIAIGAPLLTAVESRPPTAEEFAELKARVTQHEALIEKLLARAAPPEEPAIAPPAGDSLLSPGTHLRWLRRDPDEAATATHMASKAAGFPIASRLDAALRPDESVLITGRSGSS